MRRRDRGWHFIGGKGLVTHRIVVCLLFLFVKQNCLPQSAPWTIRKRVDEVMVSFTVTKGRKYVDDLAQAEVKIRDDHKVPARISALAHERDLPLRLGLLVDVSDSIRERFQFETNAANEFVRHILRPNTDRMFVMGFSQQVNLSQDFTNTLETLENSISSLSVGGQTAMYDAALEGCQKMPDPHESDPTARILVLLSDGDDNSSQSTLNQVIECTRRREVTIYAVSTNNIHAGTAGNGALKRLAEETGGKAFFPNGIRDTEKAFRLVEQEMRGRYVVSYQPKDLKLDGQFHHIEIVAERARNKFHVHARQGYYAAMDLKSP